MSHINELIVQCETALDVINEGYSYNDAALFSLNLPAIGDDWEGKVDDAETHLQDIFYEVEVSKHFDIYHLSESESFRVYPIKRNRYTPPTRRVYFVKSDLLETKVTKLDDHQTSVFYDVLREYKRFNNHKASNVL